MAFTLQHDISFIAALLLKLEKRIAEIPIESKELGFTKPGPYIYELLADLNITYKTASELTRIIGEAESLLEEENQQKANGTTICRLDSICDFLNVVFRTGQTAHANYYRVSMLNHSADGFVFFVSPFLFFDI